MSTPTQHPLAQFTRRVLSCPPGKYLRIQFDTHAQAIRYRFQFYSWRKRAQGVDPRAFHITISVIGSTLFATIDSIHTAHNTAEVVDSPFTPTHLEPTVMDAPQPAYFGQDDQTNTFFKNLYSPTPLTPQEQQDE